MKPNLKIVICGEHGGDPKTIDFCYRSGLSYVSCSPYRVPLARLAAAQAVINNENGGKVPGKRGRPAGAKPAADGTAARWPGRPPKAKSPDAPAGVQVIKKRGRPAKAHADQPNTVAPAAVAGAVAKKRGRPAKAAVATTATKAVGEAKKRGRKAKAETAAKATEAGSLTQSTENKVATIVVKRGRGRPPKANV